MHTNCLTEFKRSLIWIFPLAGPFLFSLTVQSYIFRQFWRDNDQDYIVVTQCLHNLVLFSSQPALPRRPPRICHLWRMRTIPSRKFKTSSLQTKLSHLLDKFCENCVYISIGSPHLLRPKPCNICTNFSQSVNIEQHHNRVQETVYDEEIVRFPWFEPTEYISELFPSAGAHSRSFMSTRLPNFHAKSCEICVYKWVASHLSRPKIRNTCTSVSQPSTRTR